MQKLRELDENLDKLREFNDDAFHKFASVYHDMSSKYFYYSKTHTQCYIN